MTKGVVIMPCYLDKKSKTWYTQFYYTDFTGIKRKTFKRGFRTKKEAQEYERTFLHSKQKDCTMPFKTYCNCYLSDVKPRVKLQTYNLKERILRLKIVPFFENKQLNQITSEDILSWQNELLLQNLSRTYLRTIHNNMWAIFNHAVRYYGLQNNPCSASKKLGNPKPKKLNFWTLDEYLKFIDVVRKELPGMYPVLYEVLFFSGARLGEILALTFDDITNEGIDINKTYYRYHKEDHITEPKSEKSIRTVSLPAFVMNELNVYMKSIYNPTPIDRIFPITHRPVESHLNALSKKAGVKKIRVHDLRHSHAALLIRQGVTPYAIKERLGHESITTTLNTYGALYPDADANIATMINNLAKKDYTGGVK